MPLLIVHHELNLCATLIATQPTLPPCPIEVDDKTGLLNVNGTHRWCDGARVLANCRLCGKSRRELRLAARRGRT